MTGRFVLAYDVPDDRRRAKLARLLEGFGDRVQYSVFELILRERELAELRRRIAALIDPDEDSVRLYFVCSSCFRKIEDLGRSVRPPFDAPEVLIF